MYFNYNVKAFTVEKFSLDMLSFVACAPNNCKCVVQVFDLSGKEVGDLFTFSLNKENMIDLFADLYCDIERSVNNVNLVSFRVFLVVTSK
jgi:hypothetical protein